jgi:ribosomal protein L12E/L44/L45/RPP1/RPP2
VIGFASAESIRPFTREREREREREEEEEEEEESREKSGGGIFEDCWRDRKKN